MIDRRTLIQSAPVAALAIGATANTAEATDLHAEWVAEQKTLFKSIFAPGAPDAELDDPRWVRCTELDKLISTTQAKTPAGAAAQLEFAMSEEANFDLTGGVAEDLDGQVLRNVLTTLKSLI
ncbi:hypothetical protein [uncultured Ruegeria sp.]|uniref:hypothetical protein n=1 Tax=uncultured Ruegeria sp. TaxID=259304 RepID=UPI00261E2108|nr:hypothetical protein [uncultured Ruegeria sp.]